MGGVPVEDAARTTTGPALARATQDASPARQLERFLVDGGVPPEMALLERGGLAGHAYASGATGDRHAALRDVVNRLTVRHLRTKSLLAPLLRRCRDDGVDVVPFKGFHLAEFVYATAANRPYNDVDLLVHPERADLAIARATELGWRLRWSRRDSLYRYSHEEAVLERDGVMIELHRLALDCAAPNDARQRRLTESAWRRVERVPWQGTELALLDPVDAALFGIVLARMWSGGDDLQLKPTDYLDLRELGARRGVDVAALRTRARELGCERSLDAFLERCDPWAGRLSLASPPPAVRRAAYRAMAPERGYLPRERGWGKLRRLPGTLYDVVRQAPVVAAWAWRLRRAPELSGVALAPKPDAMTLRLAHKERIVRGVKWGARLATRGDPCLVRSLALCDAFRRRGADARIVTGRDADQRWHAWVELEPYTLSDLDDVPRCRVDQVEVRYPRLIP